MHNLLKQYSEVEIVAECENAEKTLEFIRRGEIDLVFLDIRMPGMDAFEMLGTLPKAKLPQVVFVTAYDKFALQAFRINAVDYLVKPVDEQQLDEALSRVRERKAGTRGEARIPEVLREIAAFRYASPRILLKTDGQTICINPGEIDWFEAAGNYVCVHVGKTTHVLRETMGQLERRLGAFRFVRIHRSILINAQKITSLRPAGFGDYTVELSGGKTFTLSRAFRESVLKRIEQA
jgi:two-component system LytT family response regulator